MVQDAFALKNADYNAGREWLSTAGSADPRFCGPLLFGPLMERSNSCARVGGHSHAVDDQTVRRLTDSSALMPA